MKTIPSKRRLQNPPKDNPGRAGTRWIQASHWDKGRIYERKSNLKVINPSKSKKAKIGRRERISSSSPKPIAQSEYRGGEGVNLKERAPVEDEDRWVLRMGRLHDEVFSCRAIWEKFSIEGLVHGLLVVVEKATGKTVMLVSAMSPLGEEWFWPAWPLFFLRPLRPHSLWYPG
jgi:hypothetical protein